MKTLLFIAAGLLASSVMAAGSADLTISGTVPQIDSIEIKPTALATQLDIVNGNLAAVRVANPVETSNRIAGYKISLHSRNGGNLVHRTLPLSKTTYTVSYNGEGYVSLATDQFAVGPLSLSASTSRITTVDVKVAALPLAVEGIYEDVIKISIVGN